MRREAKLDRRPGHFSKFPPHTPFPNVPSFHQASLSLPPSALGLQFLFLGPSLAWCGTFALQLTRHSVSRESPSQSESNPGAHTGNWTIG